MLLNTEYFYRKNDGTVKEENIFYTIKMRYASS